MPHLLFIAGVSTFFNIRKISAEIKAPGLVVEVISERRYLNEQDRIVQEYYFPVVQFTANDGKTRNLKMSEGSSSPDYEAGDEVIVRYNPERPLEARIQSFGSSALMWILPVITGFLGTTFLGAVQLLEKFMRDEKPGSKK